MKIAGHLKIKSFISLFLVSVVVCSALPPVYAYDMNDDGTDPYVITNTTTKDEAIEMHVFNYGTQISNGFPLYFSGCSGNLINNNSFYMGNTLDSEGYPFVMDSDKENSYSLRYLFDKESEFVQGAGTATEYNPTSNNSYQSMHFEVDTIGGSGLFQEDNDGYLYYSSFDNAARFDTETRKFILYNYIDMFYSTYGNFFFFNVFTDRTMDHASSVTNSKTGKTETDYIKSTSADYQFGLTLEFQFEIGKNGSDENGKAQIFEFTGDDDVMVFIDSVLVLDISGHHEYYNGEIDFSTGALTYSYSSLGAVNKPSEKTLLAAFEAAGADTSSFNGKTFSDGTVHTLKMFYMERGAVASTAYIKFNINPIVDVYVPVSKQYLGAESGETKDWYFYVAELIDGEWYIIDTINIKTTGNKVNLIYYLLECDFTDTTTETYMIWESVGDSGPTATSAEIIDGIIYETGFYIIKINIENGYTETEIEYYEYNKDKNPTTVDTCEFVNYKAVELTVSKTVEGIKTDLGFNFTLDTDTAKVYDSNGKILTADTDSEYSYSFTLKNGETISFWLPYGSDYTVSESDAYTGYATYINGSSDESLTVTDTITDETTVGFVNTLRALPGAGGTGAAIFMVGGVILVMLSILNFIRLSGKGRKNN